MYYKFIIIAVLVTLTTIPLLGDDVFGHGLGGDVAPPISFAGMQVTVSTMMTPSDITVGEVDSASLQIRFFDQNTNTSLKSVTYRVEIHQSGELLARETFFDRDGELNVEIRPKPGCSEAQPWMCTIYYGDREPISNGLQERGTGIPVIMGPIFTKGGLYNIQVVVLGATSPKTFVADQLEFSTFVSIAQDQFFSIPEATAEIPVTVKTYYDDVSNFEFKKSDKSISFKMPFDWSPDYVDLVQVVHEELRFPKSYEPYGPQNDFVGYVDGVQVDNRTLLVDPYSSESQNIIHFLVTASELKRINEELGPEHYSKKGLGINESDPMSGFFAFKRKIIDGLKLDAIGYKMLLEILVKTKGASVREIPYTFTNRMHGSSKLDSSTIFDYARSVWRLYRFGKTAEKNEGRDSVRFLSKAARFYTVGASGLLLNYLVSLLFADAGMNFWYIHATAIGIMFSMSSNFVLNKIWTFGDRNFEIKSTLTQYGKFIGFSSLGALVQLVIVYVLVDSYQLLYPIALVLAVATAASSNFILNKKWTFKQKVWS